MKPTTIRIMKHDVVLNVADFGEKDINNFWTTHVGNGEWEEHSFYIFDKYKNLNKVMIDFGGWLGITPLYCADKFNQVLAFECDAVALERFRANLLVNPSIQNVVIVDKAIWDKNGVIKIGTKADGSFGDSESSVHFVEKNDEVGYFGKAVEVNCTTLLSELDNKRIHPRNVGFIKMDIEGGENIVVESIKGMLSVYKPTLYLSIHHHLLTKNDVIKMLDLLFSIYTRCLVYNKEGNSFPITKDLILTNQLGDVVFDNEKIHLER